MRNCCACLFVVVCLLTSLSAQSPDTGRPPYGSFQDGAFDSINRNNLNVNFNIPIVSRQGRTLNLQFGLTYNSLIWALQGSAWKPLADVNGNPTWGWALDSVFGRIAWKLSGTCYSNYTYTDAVGTVHRFNAQTGCTTNTLVSYATDNSGYYIDLNPGATDPVVRNSRGLLIRNSEIKNTNGNYISQTIVSSTETQYRDTMNKLALKIIKNTATSPTQITYYVLRQDGAYNTYVLALQDYTISTGFGCAGVSDYSGTARMPSSLTLPNGQTYSFQYETNTGRLSQVTFPTGGHIHYTYDPTPNKSIVCTDGTHLELTRAIHEGSNVNTWYYGRVNSGTNQWDTTVTAPQLSYDATTDQGWFRFVSGKETDRHLYQGHVGGTMLEQILTTYAANGSVATQEIRMQNGLRRRRIETDFDNYGMLTGKREYDWGAENSGTWGPVLRTTSITYLTSSNLRNRPSQVIVRDGGPTGTIKSRADFSYDQTSPSCITGVTHHDDGTFGCTFNNRGNLTTATTYTNASVPSGGISKTYAYDSLGNLIRADADCCRNISYNFSSLTTYAFPDSVVKGAAGGPQTTTSYTYDLDSAALITATDENNKTTTTSYELTFNRVTGVQRPDGQSVTYSYDDSQRTVTTETPIQGSDRLRTITYFDQLGRLIKTETENVSGVLISATTNDYDPAGHPWHTSLPYTTTPQYLREVRYDGLGRQISLIEPDGATTSTQFTGPKYQITSPANNYILYDPDGLGRLKTVTERNQTTGALDQITSYSYNPSNQLIQVSQGVQTRTFTYDDAGRLTSQTLPEIGTWSFLYNQWSQQTQRTDARGVITTYSYDTLNRLTSVSYNVGSTGVPSTPGITYTYGTDSTQNNNGRLITMSDGLGGEQYSYDVLGRVTSVIKTIDGTQYTFGYAFNYAGEVTDFTHPSGKVASDTFDSWGRLATVSFGSPGIQTTFANSFTYNAAGYATQFTSADGVTTTIGYSANRMQLGTITHSTSTQTLFSLSYGYTQTGQADDGKIKRIADNVEAGRSTTYTYDYWGRLSTALSDGSTNYPQWGLQWTYDRYGNRLLQTRTNGTSAPESTLTISSSSNRITATGFSYDANGNLTSEPVPNYVYTYDAENRLVSVSGNDSIVYAYDGNGKRVKKLRSGSTFLFLYSGNQLIADYQNGGLTNDYVFRGHTLMARVGVVNTHYYHRDHLSVRLITNPDGSVAGENGHYPFGEVSYATGTSTPFKFSTYDRDESGNDYAIARFHSSRLGRFLQPDQLAGSQSSPQSLNKYAYTTNDPISMFDPSGLGECIASLFDDRKFLGDLSGKFSDALMDDEDYDFEALCGNAGGGGGGDYSGGDMGSGWDSGGDSAPQAQNLDSYFDGDGNYVIRVGVSATALPDDGEMGAIGQNMLHGSDSGIWSQASQTVDNIGMAEVGVMSTAFGGALFEGAAGTSTLLGVETPYGVAYQEFSPAALDVANSVSEGATVSRGGVLGVSNTTDAQFWAAESPLSEGYATRFDIPSQNSSFNFVETGTVNSDSYFITRTVQGGSGIEIVTPPGGVSLKSFSFIGPF